MPEYIAKLQISPVRRWAGVIVMAAIGLGLLYSGVVFPPESILGRMSIFALGLMLLIQAYWNTSVKSGALVLKEDGLWVEGGERLADLENIKAVETGPFAIKPSNGFAVVLNKPMSAKWVPGLYWVVGRRVGVGGAAHPSQAKAMAELLGAMLVRH